MLAPNIRHTAPTVLCFVRNSFSLYYLVTLKGPLLFYLVPEYKDYDQIESSVLG